MIFPAAVPMEGTRVERLERPVRFLVSSSLRIPNKTIFAGTALDSQVISNRAAAAAAADLAAAAAVDLAAVAVAAAHRRTHTDRACHLCHLCHLIICP